MLIEDRTKPQGPTAGPWGKRFMTMAEFAVLMKCTVVTVNRWIKEGQLRVLHVISEDEVKKFKEELKNMKPEDFFRNLKKDKPEE